MPSTKNVNTNTNKNNINIKINLADTPKRKRTQKRSQPPQTLPPPPVYNSAIYYPQQTTYVPENVPTPAGFESARANQSAFLDILSRSAQHLKEAQDIRAMYDRDVQPTMTNVIADIGLPAEPVQPVQPVQEPYDVRDNPLAEDDNQPVEEQPVPVGGDLPEGFINSGDGYVQCMVCDSVIKKTSIQTHLNSQKHKKRLVSQ